MEASQISRILSSSTTGGGAINRSHEGLWGGTSGQRRLDDNRFKNESWIPMKASPTLMFLKKERRSKGFSLRPQNFLRMHCTLTERL